MPERLSPLPASTARTTRPGVAAARRGPWAAVLALAAAGCAPLPTDRVVLLPEANGRVGAVNVRTERGEVLLDRAYTRADAGPAGVQVQATDAAAVRERYGALLDMQPRRPQRWTVYFDAGGTRLNDASRAVLLEVRSTFAAWPSAELVVIGHTDRVGRDELNDRLSRERAQVVRSLLVGAGVPAERVVAQGRGEREPVVPTADEVAEPRNRRVEIKAR